MAKEGRGLKFETPLYKRDRDRLHAEVARLEGELAEVQTKYDRLLFTHDEVTLPMLYEADERLKVLEPANAALVAVLRGRLSGPWTVPGGFKKCGECRANTELDGHSADCPWLILDAALSPDAGKGSRVPYGQETRAVWGKDGKPCHDCAVRVGGLHQPGCDVEECPVCHLQLITCVCDDATLDALGKEAKP